MIYLCIDGMVLDLTQTLSSYRSMGTLNEYMWEGFTFTFTLMTNIRGKIKVIGLGIKSFLLILTFNCNKGNLLIHLCLSKSFRLQMLSPQAHVSPTQKRVLSLFLLLFDFSYIFIYIPESIYIGLVILKMISSMICWYRFC